MTYPPSGSFGQQPDPYGQQQGGFPQVQYGGLSGGEPPKKNNSAVIATIVVVVVLLAGIGVTGFVAPGFFLGDDEEDKKQTGNTSSTSKGSGDEDLQAFAEDLVGAANDSDRSALRDMTCSGARDRLDYLIEGIDEASDFKLDDVGKPDGDEAELKIRFEVDSEKRVFTANVSKDGGDWCWDAIDGDFDDPTTEESTTDETTTDETTTPAPDEGGAAFVDQFLATLAAGDAATATTMLCADSGEETEVAEVAPQLPQLVVDPSTVDAGSGYWSADLTGTMAGASVTGMAFGSLEDAGWCMSIFSVYA